MISRSSLLVAAALLAAPACDDGGESPLAPSTAAPSAMPAAVATLQLTQLSAGGMHTCGLAADSLAYCWGVNKSGEVGNGSRSGLTQCGPPVWDGIVCRPVAVVGGIRFRQISAGIFHTCGVTGDNRVFCWGQTGALTSYQPALVAGGRRFRVVDAGYNFSCGITTPDNRAYCWGDNHWGQLGDGTELTRYAPVPVAGTLQFRQISAGESHACGVTTDHRALCWGWNWLGKLGDSTAVDRRLTPTLVAGGRSWRQVDAGYAHSCGVTTSGRAYCWGGGSRGQLGTGRTYRSLWPRAVRGRLLVARVTAGSEFHSCAETTTKRAFCWGDNTFGQLGDGTTTTRLVPVAVAGGLYFSQVGAGDLHTCGKAGNGTVYCWGDGTYGELGNDTSGATIHRTTPQPVLAAMQALVSVAAP